MKPLYFLFLVGVIIVAACVRIPSEVVFCIAPDSITTTTTQECTDTIITIDSTTRKGGS